MRPIDADQFKENILSGLYIYCQENKDDIANAIDSEPTIITSLNLDNITEENIEKFKMIWQRANSKGLLTINVDRPQGEWIEVGDNQPYSKDKLYGCSKCRFGSYLLSDTKNVNFCPNCGADMRKGGAE